VQQLAQIHTFTDLCLTLGSYLLGRVVYGCPAEVLGQISGEELDVDCRQIMSAGALHSVEVVGPVLGEECANQHRDFWPRFIAQGHSVV
jgi:tRNA(Arg) A34 adenosine deaminase TadA